MINIEIKNGLLQRLEELEPNIPKHDEQIKQGFHEPAFFVKELSSGQKRGLSRRYNRTMLFTVRFHPDPHSLSQKTDCVTMAGRLYEQLEYVEWSGTVFRGRDLRHEVVEDIGAVLHFFISFDVRLVRSKTASPKMQKLKPEVQIK